jgi:dUTP pyrophosphatase
VKYQVKVDIVEFNMDLTIELVSPFAVEPSYSTEGSSGWDLISVDDEIVIHPGQTRKIDTGIKYNIPEDWEIQVRPRSGTSYKTKLRIANTPGTIDSDYVGVLAVLVDNIGDTIIKIPTGLRFAQAVLCPIGRATFKTGKVEKKTARGEGGYGSTGDYGNSSTKA